MADTPHLTIRCEYPDTDMKVRYAMDLHPEEAYEYQSASSPLALIYAKGEGDDDGTYAFTHRTIIMAEADSLAENGPAGSAIRSLVEDNEMVYKTLIDQKPVTINKKGPTGLITTGIRPLPCQLSTRVLEVHLDPDQDAVNEVLYLIVEQFGRRILAPHQAEYRVRRSQKSASSAAGGGSSLPGGWRKEPVE